MFSRIESVECILVKASRVGVVVFTVSLDPHQRHLGQVFSTTCASVATQIEILFIGSGGVLWQVPSDLVQ